MDELFANNLSGLDDLILVDRDLKLEQARQRRRAITPLTTCFGPPLLCKSPRRYVSIIQCDDVRSLRCDRDDSQAVDQHLVLDAGGRLDRSVAAFDGHREWRHNAVPCVGRNAQPNSLAVQTPPQVHQGTRIDGRFPALLARQLERVGQTSGEGTVGILHLLGHSQNALGQLAPIERLVVLRKLGETCTQLRAVGVNGVSK